MRFYGAGYRRGRVWSGSNTPVIQGRHICAQIESERAACSPGVVPIRPCMCCLSFPSRRRRPGYRCPYISIDAAHRGRPQLGLFIVSPLKACHHASHIASDSPGPVTKYSFIVEHELGQGSRAPQENHQRALRENKGRQYAKNSFNIWGASFTYNCSALL